MNKLKVGLIVDDNEHSEMVKYLLNASIESKNFSIETLIVQKTFRTQKSLLKRSCAYVRTRGLKRFMQDIFFKLILIIENQLLRIFTRIKNSDISNNFNLSSFNHICITPNISKSGFVYTYSAQDLKLIKDQNLDILVRGGSGILRGDILNLCRFGVISFHHGDNDFYRGGPPGFWEVYNEEPSTGFIIQRLTEELDGGDVLFKGSIATSFMYSLNLYKLNNKANVFLPKLLESISKNDLLPNFYPKKVYKKEIYKTPNFRIQAHYLVKTFFRSVKKIINILFKRGLRWKVAYQFTQDWKNADLKKSIKIKNPPNRFYADPFIFNHDGRSVCFVEDYCYKEKKGSISAIEINKSGYKNLGVVLKEDFHLSYPYIFEVNNQIYMCPESHQSKEIRIYKCNRFPDKWSLHKIIMKGVSAMDSIIFKDNGRWWLMTNIDSSSLGHEGSELHIFYSDSFDSDNWKSHSKNPVIFDSRKGRNGGFIKDLKNKYRVHQSAGFDIYGESMGISKINNISENQYFEEEIVSIHPNFFKNIKGTHTYSYADGLLAFDYVESEKIDV